MLTVFGDFEVGEGPQEQCVSVSFSGIGFQSSTVTYTLCGNTNQTSIIVNPGTSTRPICIILNSETFDPFQVDRQDHGPCTSFNPPT